MAEHARATRPDLSPGTQQSAHQPAVNAAAGAADARLPFNRKERYFTGTVLPALLAHDGFQHLGKLLDLAGLPDDLVDPGRDGTQDLQLFSEYSFSESLLTPADRARFPDAPVEMDTPDLVLTGADWLLAVEAKVYDVPSRASMTAQLKRQRLLVEYWTTALRLPPDRVKHVLLVPAELEADLQMNKQGWKVITWQEVADAYRPVGPRHFTAVLDEALARYSKLKSVPLQFRKNAQDILTGAQLKAVADAGETTYTYMGRSGGLHGAALKKDLDSGQWSSTSYEVRGAAVQSKNWFPIADFIARLP